MQCLPTSHRVTRLDRAHHAAAARPCVTSPVSRRTVRAAAANGNGQGPSWLLAAQQLLQKVLGSDEGPSSSAGTTTTTAAKADPAAPTEVKSDDYTEEMQAKMGTTLTYRHEDGINYNFIMPDLIVGSCLQTPEDADKLAAAGVTTVYSLQEDCDMEYFGIDIAAIQERCKEVGIKHVRFPVRDFDPYDLRQKLPKAVTALAKAHDPRNGIAYIHCTAGLGRAPATALAYMYWLRGWQLPEALEALTSKRRCSPRVEAIRAATADLLTDSRPCQLTVGIRRRGTAQTFQVAGLDVGWHTMLDLQENPKTKRLEVTREVLPGTYNFKFIVDGRWVANHDYPTYLDGANINNCMTVLPRDAHDNNVRERLLAPAAELLPDERITLSSKLCPWDTHTRNMHLTPSGAPSEDGDGNGTGQA